MSEIARIGCAVLMGCGLGAVFFAGLWWTVRRGLASTQPAMLFLVSMLVRTLTVVAGFYFVAQGDWRNVVACLVGFLLARLLITRTVGSAQAHEQKIQGAVQ